MIRLVFVLACLHVACHHESARRIFELRGLDRSVAVALTAEKGGANSELTRLSPDSTRLWSTAVPSFDTAHVRIVVSELAVYVLHREALGWMLDSFAMSDGKREWQRQFPVLAASGDPELRITHDAIVIWSGVCLLVVAPDTGTARAFVQLSSLDLPPAVTERFVLAYEGDHVVAIDLKSGGRSTLKTAAEGCADLDRYYAWEKGELVSRSLSDLNSKVVLAHDDIAMSVRECGHFRNAVVLTAAAMWNDRVSGIRVLVVENGTVLHAFDRRGDASQSAIVAFEWRGYVDRNGELSRYIPLATRRQGSREVTFEVLDLQDFGAKTVPVTWTGDVLMFHAGATWMAVPANDAVATIVLFNGLDGTNSTAVLTAEKLPAIEPNDVVDSVVWLASSKWGSGEPKFQRLLASTLRPLSGIPQ